MNGERMTRRDYADQLADAAQAVREDVLDGASPEWSLDHYADLFEVRRDDLQHEYDLRHGGRL